jgi:hypothetical protein
MMTVPLGLPQEGGLALAGPTTDEELAEILNGRYPPPFTHEHWEQWVVQMKAETLGIPITSRAASFERLRAQPRCSESREVTLHGLRHSFTTTAIEDGIDPKTVSALLGHSTVRTTRNIYARATNPAKRDAIARLSGIFAQPEHREVPNDAVEGCQQFLPAARRKKAKTLAMQRSNVVAPTGVEPVSQP